MNKNNETSLNPFEIDFFYDFILFLKRLEQQPIKRTITGTISLSDIKQLLLEFKDQEKIQEYKEYGWKMRREEELDFLEQIKIISEMMFAIYKRRGFYYLSKNGKAFLQNLKPISQYREIVLHFWYRVNWGYFSFGKTICGLNLAEKLQENQNHIWKALFSKGTAWIDYAVFCQSLTDYLHLSKYFHDDYNSDIKDEMYSDIKHALFRKNLIRLGCVEIEEKQGKHKSEKQIVRFRSNNFGLYVYDKALYQNVL
jgi:hypothetical protein